MLSRVIFAAYLIESGLVLVVAPWTAFWDRNYFASLVPGLAWVMASSACRGATSGLGLVTAFLGLREFASAVRGRARAGRPPAGAGSLGA